MISIQISFNDSGWNGPTDNMSAKAPVHVQILVFDAEATVPCCWCHCPWQWHHICVDVGEILQAYPNM